MTLSTQKLPINTLPTHLVLLVRPLQVVWRITKFTARWFRKVHLYPTVDRMVAHLLPFPCWVIVPFIHLRNLSPLFFSGGTWNKIRMPFYKRTIPEVDKSGASVGTESATTHYNPRRECFKGSAAFFTKLNHPNIQPYNIITCN